MYMACIDRVCVGGTSLEYSSKDDARRYRASSVVIRSCMDKGPGLGLAPDPSPSPGLDADIGPSPGPDASPGPSPSPSHCPSASPVPGASLGRARSLRSLLDTLGRTESVRERKWEGSLHLTPHDM